MDDANLRIAAAIERIAAALEGQLRCQKDAALRSEALQMASIGDTPTYERYQELVKEAGHAGGA